MTKPTDIFRNFAKSLKTGWSVFSVLVNSITRLLTNFCSSALPTFNHTQRALCTSVSERRLFFNGNLANLSLYRCKPYLHTSNSNYKKFLYEASMISIKRQTRPCWKQLTPTPMLDLVSSGVFFSPSFTVISTYKQGPGFPKLKSVYNVCNT